MLTEMRRFASEDVGDGQQRVSQRRQRRRLANAAIL
jgi:hypothetical protein